MWKITFQTSLVVTIVMTLFLKILQLFSWVDWHPTAFLKEDVDDAVLRWLVLAIIIFMTTFILYMLLQYTYKLPPYIVGLVVGLVAGIVVEWWLLDLVFERRSFKALSIPFLVLVTTAVIFTVETATFHRERFVNRNNLPYKRTMLK